MLTQFSCVDPTTPVFAIKEGLVYIEGYVSNTEGASYVVISESVINEFNEIAYENVGAAQVFFNNVTSGDAFMLDEFEGAYFPPDDFVTSPGDEWELSVTLADGRTYLSEVEVVTEPVSIGELAAEYNPELVFVDSENDFFGGHILLLELEDPIDRDNYYLWKFRSFETLNLCANCIQGKVLRGGECELNQQAVNTRIDQFDYFCATDCWRIRYNEGISIFSDEFSNSSSIALPVGNVLLYSKENIVVEILQYSISAKAYEYFEVLKDLVDNNSALNSPPPAALIGNLFNPNDFEEPVLGRFTAAATSKESIFIPRNEINGRPIDVTSLRVAFPEACIYVCPPADQPACEGAEGGVCPVINIATCDEGRFRTSFEPEGWIDPNNN